MLLYKQDRTSREARRLMRRALAICLAELGAAHPRTKKVLVWLKRVDMKCTRGKGKGCKCCAKSKKPASGAGNEESPAAALNLAEFTAMCEAPEAAAEEGGGGTNAS